MVAQCFLMAFKFLRNGSMKGGDQKFSKTALLTGGWDIKTIARILTRFFQFLMGIVVIGLYAQDLDRAHKKGVGYDPLWMYATMTGVIACVWSLICMLPLVKAWMFFVVDYIVFILYLVAFGKFGSMYIKEDPEGNKGIIRMKNAVWVLLTNMFLWVGTATYGAIILWKSKKAKTAHTSPHMTEV